MAKRKTTPAGEHAEALRRGAREAYVEALRDGRKERAATFTDRRREASRKACRGRRGYDD